MSDFSFTLETRTVVGLIGPNGSGKSTTVNVLTGIYAPSAGRVMLGGQDISGLPTHEIARRGLVRTFQDPRLVASFTVLENVLLGAHMHLRYGLAEASLGVGRMAAAETAGLDRAAAVLELTGLTRSASRFWKRCPMAIAAWSRSPAP